MLPLNSLVAFIYFFSGWYALSSRKPTHFRAWSISSDYFCLFLRHLLSLLYLEDISLAAIFGLYDSIRQHDFRVSMLTVHLCPLLEMMTSNRFSFPLSAWETYPAPPLFFRLLSRSDQRVQPAFFLLGSYCSLSKRNVASKSIKFLVWCIPVRPQAIKVQMNHNYTFRALLERFLSACKTEWLNEPIRNMLILLCM